MALLLRKLFETPNDSLMGLARIVAGIVFFPHGTQKVFGWFGGSGFAATMQFFTQTMHIPAAFGFLAIMAEFAGGLGLILGLFGRIAAFGIFVEMIVAVAMVHSKIGRVTDAFRKKSLVSTLQIIPVDGTADRIAGSIFWVRVAGRGDVYVQVTVRTDRQILQLMAVGSSEFRAAGVWQIRYNHLFIEQLVTVGFVAESTDLVRFTDVNVGFASDRSKNHPVRKP